MTQRTAGPTMRAWRVTRHGAPRDALSLADVEVPDPPAGFLRVRVKACALGLPDYLMCGGSYLLTPKLPFTPGQELSGVVTAVGEGAQARVGDSVMGVSAFFLGHGGFAEQALLVGDFALPAPEALDDLQAAGFAIPYHTAWIGLVRRAALQPGETLLVLGGSGGTGSAAIQLGRALGARVLASAGGERNVRFCRELGAERVIDRRREDIADAVRDATDGRGADVIYDPVGGDAFAAATRCIAHEGRLLVVGFASGRWGDVSSEDLAYRNYSVMGVIPSGYDHAFRLAAHKELLALHSRGAVRVPVASETPFTALPDALAALAAGDVLGKAVLLD